MNAKNHKFLRKTHISKSEGIARYDGMKNADPNESVRIKSVPLPGVAGAALSYMPFFIFGKGEARANGSLRDKFTRHSGRLRYVKRQGRYSAH